MLIVDYFRIQNQVEKKLNKTKWENFIEILKRRCFIIYYEQTTLLNITLAIKT
jgi:hypothetical protein